MNIQSTSEFYFSQNLTAAQEGALLARLNRSKSALNKMKVSLTTFEHGSDKYNSIEADLLTERTRYYQILNQLNKMRARSNSLEQADESNIDKQHITYLTDRDIYTPQFMTVSKSTSRYEYIYNGGNSGHRVMRESKNSLIETAAAVA